MNILASLCEEWHLALITFWETNHLWDWKTQLYLGRHWELGRESCWNCLVILSQQTKICILKTSEKNPQGIFVIKLFSYVCCFLTCVNKGYCDQSSQKYSYLVIVVKLKQPSVLYTYSKKKPTTQTCWTGGCNILSKDKKNSGEGILGFKLVNSYRGSQRSHFY